LTTWYGNQDMIEIPGRLSEAEFIERLARFTALVRLGIEPVPAHLPTSSRMRELLVHGMGVILADRRHLRRLTAYDLVMVRNTTGLVSVDAGVPNKLMEWALRRSALEYTRIRLSGM